MNTCPGCGYENAATSRFCRRCGAILTVDSGWDRPCPVCAIVFETADDYVAHLRQAHPLTGDAENDTPVHGHTASSLVSALVAPGGSSEKAPRTALPRSAPMSLRRRLQVSSAARRFQTSHQPTPPWSDARTAEPRIPPQPSIASSVGKTFERGLPSRTHLSETVPGRSILREPGARKNAAQRVALP
jgi:hypothetical protein